VFQIRGAQILGVRSPFQINYMLWHLSLWLLRMKFPSSLPFGAYKVEVFPRVLKILLTPVQKHRSKCRGN